MLYIVLTYVLFSVRIGVYSPPVPLMVDLTPDDIATYTTRFHSILVDGEKKHYLEEQLTDVNKLLSDEKFVHRNPFANVTIAALDSKLHSRRAKMSKRLRTRASRSVTCSHYV